MSVDDQPIPRARGPTPASFPAAAAALNTIHEALHTARTTRDEEQPEHGRTSSEQTLAALLLLREVRGQLAGWEAGLIEAARHAGVSWAGLAHPLGVSSRQAAERRYLRIRPGQTEFTGEQRIQTTRDRRAADRIITAWARANAADLRRLSGQITALTDLPATARTPLADLTTALVGPLTAAYAHLASDHPDLAARVNDVARHTDRLRRRSADQRRYRA